VKNLFIADISTEDLVKELELREGVEKIIAEPHKEVCIKEIGPAIILVIND
jgi:hypothetical protein